MTGPDALREVCDTASSASDVDVGGDPTTVGGFGRSSESQQPFVVTLSRRAGTACWAFDKSGWLNSRVAAATLYRQVENTKL